MYPKYPYYGQTEVCQEQNIAFPAQQQDVQPGMEYEMKPRPIFDNPAYQGSGKLKGKTAIITGGDSGIGRAVAIAYAKEGANVVIVYLNEHIDAKETMECLSKYPVRTMAIAKDLRHEQACYEVIEQVYQEFGAINILVNNSGVQYVKDSILDISAEQLHQTFTTNVYSFFYMTKAALRYMKEGDNIINTASIVAYQGMKNMIDYSATKGAIVTFTRSLSLSLIDQGIRVNGVAPGFFWTPLQPASQKVSDIMTFGVDTPIKRAGQPFEIAPAYVYLASDDAKYVTGEMMHVNGGEFITT